MVFTAPLFSFLSTAVARSYPGELSATATSSYLPLILTTAATDSSPAAQALRRRGRFLPAAARPCLTTADSSRPKNAPVSLPLFPPRRTL